MTGRPKTKSVFTHAFDMITQAFAYMNSKKPLTELFSYSTRNDRRSSNVTNPEGYRTLFHVIAEQDVR